MTERHTSKAHNSKKIILFYSKYRPTSKQKEHKHLREPHAVSIRISNVKIVVNLNLVL